MINTLNVFLDPPALFNKLDKRPNWLMPFIIVVSLGAITTVLNGGLMQHLVGLQLPEGVSEDLKKHVMDRARIASYFGIAIVPILVLLKWSISAFVLYAIMVLLGADVSYRKTLSILGHASIISALDTLLSIIVLYSNGIESIRKPDQIRLNLLSLDHLLNATAHPAIRVLLQEVNVMSVWYCAVLAAGVYAIARFSKKQSAFVVVGAWLLRVGFEMGLVLLVAPSTTASA